MKIVIPTNDITTLAQRSGRAKYFMIFEIEERKIINTIEKENNHDHNHSHAEGHSHEHSHADMIEQLKGCDLMITKKVGPHFGVELKSANIEVKICQAESIEDALKSYLD